MKRLYTFILCMFLLGNIYSQLNIAGARTLPVGATVNIRGIVTNGGELGTIRYVQDHTAGIAIYDYDVDYFQRGDSVYVTGVLDDYNNLLEITNVSVHIVLASGLPDPTPVIVTPDLFSDEYESELVQIEDAVFANAGSEFQAGNSYNFTSNGQMSSVYIRADHPLIHEVIPGNPVTLVGICSQFYANYQLLLRDTNDIINTSTINIITPVTVSNISTTGFNLSWTTDTIGNSGILYGYTPELELGELTVMGDNVDHEIELTSGGPAEIFYIKAFSFNSIDTAYSNIGTYCTQSLSSGDIKVYFTTEVDNSVSSGTDAITLDDAIDDTLVSYINRAKYSIDIAIYDFNINNIVNIADALNSAFASGIDVRAIYDTTWSDINLGALLDISLHSLIAPSDEAYGIMHNKFVIIDAMSTDPNDPIVWTGSTNFEGENINDFANNVVIIQDQSLAKAYTLEFQEMWGSVTLTPDALLARFGPYKEDNTPHEFIINGDRVECYFSPSDQTTGHIVKSIQSANELICAETMLITRYDISDALIERNSQGINTKVIVNDDAFCNATIVDELTQELGYFFREYGEAGILHHKVLIVDPNNDILDPLVLTGSHNWSNAAENSNDENTLIIHNQEIANIYYQEFKARFQNAISLSSIEDGNTNSIGKQFPNPFSDVFYIDMRSDKSEAILIEIYNIEGKIIYSNQVQVNIGNNQIEINDFNAAPGIYILKLRDNEKIYSAKIIKE